MKFPLLQILAGFAVLVPLDLTVAKEPKAKEPSGAVPTNEEQVDSLEPKFEELQKAQSLIGRRVYARDDSTFGTVQDLVLDLETGHLALAVISTGPAAGSSGACVAVPLVVLQNKGEDFEFRADVADECLAAVRKVDAASLGTVFNRAWALQEYNTFECKPYWAETKLAEKENFDTSEYRLSLLSSLENQPVTDSSAKTIGTIEDFAVSRESGRIAYAALKLRGDESDKRYPLPLGSFVVPPSDEPWQVELDTEAIRNTPSFSANEWPNKVERAWVEYVHVRYGRSPLGGVQHQERAKPK